VTIRHADLNELDNSSVEDRETRKQLDAWWHRWDSLPVVVRDQAVAETLAGERNRG
jgi:hypothetical protein